MTYFSRNLISFLIFSNILYTETLLIFAMDFTIKGLFMGKIFSNISYTETLLIFAMDFIIKG